MQVSVPSSPSMSAATETALTYDEVSMHRSRHFVMALQELKNLRPQLHSAAEYCESSYLYSEQKQAVLENLKDYSVKALVNAVDHLGTVATKLNDLLEQQTAEISSTEMRVASLAQRLRTCQEFTDHEALKQQCLTKAYPRHYKHYTLPDAGNTGMPKTPVPDVAKREAFAAKSPKQEIEPLKADVNLPRSTTPDSKASGSPQPVPNKTSNGVHSTSSPTTRQAFSRGDSFPASPNVKSATGTPRQNKGAATEESKSLSSLMSTEGDRPHKELRPVPSRSKSMFMSLLGKTKTLKSTKSGL